MKKAVSILLIIAVCITFAACAKSNNKYDENVESIVSTTQKQGFTAPEVNTTKAPEKDSQRGDALKSGVKEIFGEGEISGDFSIGNFKFKNQRDIEVVFANERSEEFEKKARENADKVVEKIGKYYSDDIKNVGFEAQQIGSGENGIDSVRYKLYYINTQNQLLTIYADSDGVISYADCTFTW